MHFRKINEVSNYKFCKRIEPRVESFSAPLCFRIKAILERSIDREFKSSCKIPNKSQKSKSHSLKESPQVLARLSIEVQLI